MKKIFFILAFFVINTNVNAITVTIGDLNKNLCSNDGKIYHIYYANIQDRETYLLKPSEKIGIDIKNYYNVSFENTSFPNDLKDYYFAFILFQNHFKSMYTYHALTQRLIWDYLYPDKEYKFCLDNKTIYDFHEDEYQSVKKQIQSVILGPDFFNQENVQFKDITMEYKFDYLSSYYIYDNDSLDAYIDGNTLYVKGKPGNYKIKFKKNRISYPVYLFDTMLTDGDNYLFGSHSQNDVTYEMNIKIIEKNVNVILYDNNEVLYNECIYYNDNKYCPNEKGIINLILDSDEYKIVYKDSDKYENNIVSGKFSKANDIIKINLVNKEVNNDSYEKDIGNEDNNVSNDDDFYEEEITFENTFAVSFVPLIILLIFGALFVKKKKY